MYKYKYNIESKITPAFIVFIGFYLFTVLSDFMSLFLKIPCFIYFLTIFKEEICKKLLDFSSKFEYSIHMYAHPVKYLTTGSLFLNLRMSPPLMKKI